MYLSIMTRNFHISVIMGMILALSTRSSAFKSRPSDLCYEHNDTSIFILRQNNIICEDPPSSKNITNPTLSFTGKVENIIYDTSKKIIHLLKNLINTRS